MTSSDLMTGTHAAQERDVVALLELLDDRHVALERLTHGAVLEAELGQPHADRGGLDADAVQRRVGVRREVVHLGVAVEPHHAVADAGSGAGVTDPGRERELAVADHLHELLEDRLVGALELARTASGLFDPLLRQHRDVAPA